MIPHISSERGTLAVHPSSDVQEELDRLDIDHDQHEEEDSMSSDASSTSTDAEKVVSKPLESAPYGGETSGYDGHSSEEEELVEQREFWGGQVNVPPEVYQHFCILQDGWPLASKSMRRYCESLFSQFDPSQNIADLKAFHRADVDLEAQSSTRWMSQIPSRRLTPEDKRHGLHRRTYVLEYVKKIPGSNELMACAAPHGPMKGEFITLVIKGDNRRKHNSHRWFFDGYCKARNPDLTFTTDTGA